MIARAEHDQLVIGDRSQFGSRVPRPTRMYANALKAGLHGTRISAPGETVA